MKTRLPSIAILFVLILFLAAAGNATLESDPDEYPTVSVENSSNVTNSPLLSLPQVEDLRAVATDSPDLSENVTPIADSLDIDSVPVNDTPTSPTETVKETAESGDAPNASSSSIAEVNQSDNSSLPSPSAITLATIEDTSVIKSGYSEIQGSNPNQNEISPRGSPPEAGSPGAPYFGLSVKTGASGDWPITSSAWTDVPDFIDPYGNPVGLGTGILLEGTGDLRITFTAEPNGYVQVRVLVDGVPAHPNEVFICGPTTNINTYSYTFVKSGVPAGFHTVKVQARNWGTGGSLGDRSLTVLAAPTGGALVTRSVETNIALTKPDPTWTAIPDMVCQVTTEAGSNLDITFNAEAFCDNPGEMMFVRALVDGTPANPSDVVFAYGNARWSHAFTFTKTGMSAGVHTVEIQWGMNGGTGKMYDRTLAVFTAPPAEGLSVITPASGPDQSTNSVSWVTMPGMTTSISTKPNSDIEVSVSGETNDGGHMFVRALIDGAAMDPLNVLFADGAFTGTHRFVFTKQGVSAGSHAIAVQWCTDPGRTVYMGDRSLSVIAQQRLKPDTLFIPDRSVTSTVQGNALLLLWDPHRPGHPAPDKTYLDSMVFGSEPSVRDYFLENSQGRFTLNRAGVLGYYDADYPAERYWGTSKYPIDQEDCSEDLNNNGILDPGEDRNGNGIIDGPDGILQPEEDLDHDNLKDYDLNNDGWVNGHVQKWAEAVRKADPEFYYRTYDSNGDGILEPKELTITMVIPQNSQFGTMRGVVGREVDPGNHHQIQTQPLVVDGVTIPTITEAYTPPNDPANVGLFAHEISHSILGTGDMYFYFFQPFAAGPYSLMDQDSAHPHLDPFHKFRLGWLSPTVVRSDGVYTLGDVETTGQVLVLERPEDSREEYFLIENRRSGSSYDSSIPSAGLAIWHIIEDQSVYDSLPCPVGVDCTEWNSPDWQGWSRKGIRMIRPVYGSQATGCDWRLWSGSSPATGYNLYSVDPNTTHQTLKWADGTPSGFAIENIPVAGPSMSFTVRTNLYTADPTPPASITNPYNTTYATTSINWTWTDPADADFTKVKVYLNGVFRTDVNKGVRYYLATGLSPNTAYTLGTHTVDTLGNINQTWVNHTARTAGGIPKDFGRGVFRPSSWDNWILDRSMNGSIDIRDHYGSATDKPLIGDFNNDGKADRALFRSGEWIIDYNMDGSVNSRPHYGQAGDIPLVGRMNADGVADRAVFRAGAWIVDYNMDMSVNLRDYYGTTGDIPLIGDFNNDGTPDRAVFRAAIWNNWIIDYGMDGSVDKRDHFGAAGDIPVIGDFNNDEKTDRAVFRAGEWIIDYNMNGSVDIRPRFGMAGDIPLVWNL